jgi:hypothetical protein
MSVFFSDGSNSLKPRAQAVHISLVNWEHRGSRAQQMPWNKAKRHFQVYLLNLILEHK